MFGNFTRMFVAVAFAAGTVLAGAALAGEDPVKQRSDLMKEIGGAIKKLAAIAKGEADFNGKTVAAAGTTILENLKKSSKLFPEGSMTDKSRAKAEIWTDNATFMKAFEAAEKAAQGIIKVGTEDDEIEFQGALGALGKSCKGCHEKFRKPKEEGK